MGEKSWYRSTIAFLHLNLIPTTRVLDKTTGRKKLSSVIGQIYWGDVQGVAHCVGIVVVVTWLKSGGYNVRRKRNRGKRIWRIKEIDQSQMKIEVAE